MRKLFRDKLLLSVEERNNNSSDNGNNTSDEEEVVAESIIVDGGDRDDNDNCRWLTRLPAVTVSAVVDSKISTTSSISSTNDVIKETLIRIDDNTIITPMNADADDDFGTTGAGAGTGAGAAATASVISGVPNRCRHIFVGLVTDSARVFAKSRPDVFRQSRMEDNSKKQSDQLDNGNNTSSNDDNLSRRWQEEMSSDSKLEIPAKTFSKQQQQQKQRDLRRKMYDSMLVIPRKSNYWPATAAISIAVANKRKAVDEWSETGSSYHDNKYIRTNSIVVMTNNNKRIQETTDRRLWDAAANGNDNLMRREISDSMLVIPKRNWKQQQRDFRREMSDSMLLTIPIKRRTHWKAQKQQQPAAAAATTVSATTATATATANKRKADDEWHTRKNGSSYYHNDDRYKHKINGVVTTSNKKRIESLQNFSWNNNDKTNTNTNANNNNNCDSSCDVTTSKSTMFALGLALGELAPNVTRSGDGYRKKETTSRTA
jgi:hypothetical protein